MVAGKNIFFTIIYTSCLIICASLKEIRPSVNDATRFGDIRKDGQTYGQVQLYMPPTLWGHENEKLRS
jgi:hypothetical protein